MKRIFLALFAPLALAANYFKEVLTSAADNLTFSAGVSVQPTDVTGLNLTANGELALGGYGNVIDLNTNLTAGADMLGEGYGGAPQTMLGRTVDMLTTGLARVARWPDGWIRDLPGIMPPRRLALAT